MQGAKLFPIILKDQTQVVKGKPSHEHKAPQKLEGVGCGQDPQG